MAVAGEDFLNVSWHVHVIHAFGIVPVKVIARKFVTLPVLSDGVVLLGDVEEVKGVAFADVLNTQVIYNDGE